DRPVLGADGDGQRLTLAAEVPRGEQQLAFERRAGRGRRRGPLGGSGRDGDEGQCRRADGGDPPGDVHDRPRGARRRKTLPLLVSVPPRAPGWVARPALNLARATAPGAHVSMEAL